ncbi:glycosyltransferase family 2 protein [Patescibacteria group bacterium]
MKPQIFIVILNWNGLSDTLECLSSLGEINYPNYKIVVVDNGSKNKEAEIIKEKYPEIHLIKNEKNQGFAEGNNIGMRYAFKKGADYILLLNNDTVVSPDFLNTLVDFAQKQKRIGAVGPKILYYNSNKIWFNGGKILWWIGFNRHLECLKENKKSKIKFPLEVDYITGCCILFKKESLEKVGLLDPLYFNYYEEVDWCFRAKKVGFKNMVVPKAVIWHKVSAALGKKGTKKIGEFAAFYHSRNAIIFAQKNLSGFKKIMFLISQFTFRLGLNLILCVNNQARKRYLKGLISRF